VRVMLRGSGALHLHSQLPAPTNATLVAIAVNSSARNISGISGTCKNRALDSLTHSIHFKSHQWPPKANKMALSATKAQMVAMLAYAKDPHGAPVSALSAALVHDPDAASSPKDRAPCSGVGTDFDILPGEAPKTRSIKENIPAPKTVMPEELIGNPR